MKVRITFDVDTDARRAIANSTGRKGLASYDQIVQAIYGAWIGRIEDLFDDLHQDEQRAEDLEDDDGEEG